MSKQMHTALPWAMNSDDGGWCVIKHDPLEPDAPWFIASCHIDADGGEPAANSAFIVRAVNNHYALIELAHQYASDLRHPPSADSRERRLERIAAVLAKVGA